MNAPAGRLSRGTRLGLGVVLLVYVAIRLWMASFPGYAWDIDRYKEWAIGAAERGVAHAYDVAGVDYPPLFLYPLAVAGRTHLAMGAETGVADFRNSPRLGALVRGPGLIADLLLAGLLAWLVRDGSWGIERAGEGWAWVAAMAYLWNPGVLWDSGWWGQPDGILALFVLLAFAAVTADRPSLAGAGLALGGWMKPLAAPFVPFLALCTGIRSGARGLVLGAAGGLAATAIVLAPFAVAGTLRGMLRSVLVDVGAMPVTSANAHNLWWLLGPWRDSGTVVLGVFTPTSLGLTLFLATYAVLAVRFYREARRGREAPRPGDERTRTFLTAAAIAASFFFFNTHLHENHLFPALPLVLAVAGRNRATLWLAIGCTACLFLNGFLHDPVAPYRLPGVLSRVGSAVDPVFGRPYTWVQRYGSIANAVLAGAVAWGAVRLAWNRR